MDADAYDALMQRMAAVLDAISTSYDKLVEFTDEQRQINGRLEVLIREVIRQRRNGGTNGGTHV
jgi:hypothetical protein